MIEILWEFGLDFKFLGIEKIVKKKCDFTQNLVEERLIRGWFWFQKTLSPR